MYYELRGVHILHIYIIISYPQIPILDYEPVQERLREIVHPSYYYNVTMYKYNTYNDSLVHEKSIYNITDIYRTSLTLLLHKYIIYNNDIDIWYINIDTLKECTYTNLCICNILNIFNEFYTTSIGILLSILPYTSILAMTQKVRKQINIIIINK